MKHKKIFEIPSELDEMLKEASKLLNCTEVAIMKNALLVYLRMLLK